MKLKRILLIAVLTTLSVILTGCAKKTSISEKPFNEKSLNLSDGLVFDTTQSIDNEYYIIATEEHPEFEYGMPFLIKINSDGNLTPVCDLENCEHNSKSCNAYSNMYSGRIINYEGVNYLIGEKEKNGYRTGVVIETFEDGNFNQSTEVFSRSKHLLTSLDVIIHEGWLIYLASDYQDGYKAHITAFNLKTKEVKTLIEMEQENGVVDFFTVVQDNLIYSVSTRDEETWYSTNPKWVTSVKSLNLNTDKISTLTSYLAPNTKSAQVKDEFLYTVEDEMYIYRTNLYTLEKDLILDATALGKTFDMSYGNSFHIDDSHMYYYLTDVEERYALNLETLESSFQTFEVIDYKGDFLRYTNIQGVFGDGYYLVAGDYLANTTQIRHFYVIKEEDYWNNNDKALVHIGLLKKPSIFDAYFTPGY